MYQFCARSGRAGAAGMRLAGLAVVIALAMLWPTGQASANGGGCETIQSGVWNDPHTWTNCNEGIPTADDSVSIYDSVTLTASVSAKDVTFYAPVVLDVVTYTLNIHGTSVTAHHTATISGTGGVAFAGSDGRSISVSNNQSLSILPPVTGNVGIAKTGDGTLVFAGSNTYQGATTVNAGILLLRNSSGLGSTVAGTTVADGATLALENGISVGNEALTLNWTGVVVGLEHVGALLNVSGNNSYAGPITLASNSSIGASAGKLSLSGVISGPAYGLTKVGPGEVYLSGANNYGGLTTVSAGTLHIGHNTALGTNDGGSEAGGTVVQAGATLALSNNIVVANERLLLAGALNNEDGNNSYNGQIILTGNSTVSARNGTGGTGSALSLVNTISGNFTLKFQSDSNGVVFLTNNNSGLTGEISVNGGYLVAGHNSALGTASALVVGKYGTLVLQDGISISQPAGIVLAGKLRGLAGNSAISSLIDLAGSEVSPAVMEVETGGLMTVSGAIFGNPYMYKTGKGTLRFTDSTPIALGGGIMTVKDGVLELGKSDGVRVITGSLIVEKGSLKLLASNQLDQDALSPDVVLYPGTLFDLNGFDDTVGLLALTGAEVRTGSGTLTVDNSILVNFLHSLNLGDSGTKFTSYITGTLALGSGDSVINVFPIILPMDDERIPDLVIDADISGQGPLTLIHGTVKFSGSGNNTYTGTTSLVSTYLIIDKSSALGASTEGTLLAPGATLELRGGIDIGNEPLTVSGGTARLYNASGNNIARGPVTLTGGVQVDTDEDTTLTLQGAIGGTGGITKYGAGTLILSGSQANTYIGTTDISEGTLLLQKAQDQNAIGGALEIDASSAGADEIVLVKHTSASNQVADVSAVTLKGAGARLDLNGFSDAIGTLAFNNGGTVQTGAGVLTLGGNVTLASGPANTAYITGNLNLGAATRTFTVPDGASLDVELDISANISGSGGVIKTDYGWLRIAGNNTYAGNTEVKYGVLEVAHSNGLGATGHGTKVDTPAALVFDGGIAIGNEQLELAGVGGTHGAALVSRNGNNSLQGNVVLLNNSKIRVEDGSALRLNGTVGDGAGVHGFEVDNHPLGLLELAGNNTFDGVVTVSNGTLRAFHNNSLGSTAGGTVVVGGAALELSSNINIGLEALTMAGPGVGDGGALRSLGGTSSWNGPIALSDTTKLAVDSGTLTLAGVLSGSSSLTKIGTGVLRYTGAADNMLTGTTTVAAGRLELGKTSGARSVVGPLVVGLDNNTSPVEVRLLHNDQFSSVVALTLNPNTVFNLNGFSENLGDLTLRDNSEVQTGSGLLELLGEVAVETVAGTATLAGNVEVLFGETTITIDDGSELDLLVTAKVIGEGWIVKDGPGQMELTAVNEYAGPTFIDGGELRLTGAISGNVEMLEGAILSGNGSVAGKVSGNGIVSPGTSPGTLTADALEVDSAGTLVFEIESDAHDQIVVTSTVIITNGALAVDAKHALPLGDSITLIDNRGSTPISGQFTQLYEGAVTRLGTTLYRLSYVGGDGNDLTLTAVAPEIRVEGNDNEIFAGADVATPVDGTAFGEVAVGQSLSHTFIVENTGTSDLWLSGIPAVELLNSTGAFSVVQPGDTLISPNDSVSFDVVFAPETPGLVWATVSIANDDSDENPFNFIISAEGVATYTLASGLTGNGSGVVTSAPAGIDCGSDCSEDYRYNTAVTLSAVPAADSNFAGWSGACDGTGACVVTMDAAKNVTANFVLKQYALNVALTGNGSGSVSSVPAGINCGGDCAEDYEHGTQVTLTATPAATSDFAGWSGACNGMGACVVAMDAVKNVTANFTLKQHAVTVVKLGNGSGMVADLAGDINCGGICEKVYNHGTQVNLVATAANGSAFTGWTGACSGMGACVVTADQAQTVNATFVLQGEVLAVSKAGDGTGTVTSVPGGIDCGEDCSEGYNFGTVVTLVATPATGSAFAGWTGACTGLGDCTVTMDAAKSVVASFTLNAHTLNVSKAGAGTGTVASVPAGIDCGGTCSQVVAHGATVVLNATPAPGSAFAGWSGACSGLDVCAVTMDGAKAVTATFVTDIFTLSVTKAGDGAGTVTSVPAGIDCGETCSGSFAGSALVVLSATPAPGSAFAGWSGACSGLDVCAVTMDGAKAVTATFVTDVFALSVVKAGDGAGTVTSVPAGIDCGDACSALMANGATVVLNAVAEAGSDFAGWSGACSGTGTCVVMIDEAREVTATFAAQLAPAIHSSSLLQVGRSIEFQVLLNLDGMTACTWDFGDGTTAPCFTEVVAAEADGVQTISVRGAHTFAKAGDYIVSVTAVNDVESETVTWSISLREMLFMLGLQK